MIGKDITAMTSVYSNTTLNVQTVAQNENNYSFDYDVYMYPGYKFERPVYLYVWEILVTLTFLQNILIVSVFMRRKMRNPTNIILSALAISDSLTGLVTLPTYIMVFQRYDPFNYDEVYIGDRLEYEKDQSSVNVYINNESLSITPLASTYIIPLITGNAANISFHSTTPNPHTVIIPTENTSTALNSSDTIPPVDGYALTEDLCQNFMISKYFLSKSFHTVSIFLTLFLEIQRYVSLAYPYRYDQCFNRFKVVYSYCISVLILSPLLHVFHIFRDKAVRGLCQWELSGVGCGKDCIYLWISFTVRHLIPCVTLVIFTILFLRQLAKGAENFRRTDSSSSQYSKRVSENRRISLIVTTVVVVRLIPEISYSIFLLFNGIDISLNKGKEIDLETNRIFHLCYEIFLVCSFLAHFYIYMLFHNTFRKHLYETFIKPVRDKFSDRISFHACPSIKPVKKIKSTKSDSINAVNEVPIHSLNCNKLDVIENNSKGPRMTNGCHIDQRESTI